MITVTHEPQTELKMIALSYADFDSERGHVMAICNGNDIVSLIMYDNFIPECRVQIHIHTLQKTLYLTKNTLGAIFSFAFDFLGVRSVHAVVDVSNKSMIQYAQRLGFTPEGTLRQCSKAGNDVYIGGMLKHECKWLKYGRKFAARHP